MRRFLVHRHAFKLSILAAMLKPNTRRKLPSIEPNLDNPRGLISPSVKGFLLSFPYALGYVFGLTQESFTFLVFGTLSSPCVFKRFFAPLLSLSLYVVDWLAVPTNPACSESVYSQYTWKSRSFRTGLESQFFAHTEVEFADRGYSLFPDASIISPSLTM